MVTKKITDDVRKKLIDAQLLLSDVYDFACEYGFEHLEDQMSCADSCIIESLDYMEGL